MKLKKLLMVPVAAVSLLSVNLCLADEDRMPVAVETPARGIDMERVQVQFGEPNDRYAAVGNPPLTRWVYGQFTVYYEHQYVLQTVIH